MCLAMPLHVAEINGKNAFCETEGLRREIRIDFVPRVKVGDYVIVHAGFAIEIIDPKRAKENIEAMMEVYNAAREL